MASQPTPAVSPQEYLALERRATVKSEYHDGTIVAMAGASRAHNLIVGDTNVSLIQQLRGRPCETYTSTAWRKSVPGCGSLSGSPGRATCGVAIAPRRLHAWSRACPH